MSANNILVDDVPFRFLKLKISTGEQKKTTFHEPVTLKGQNQNEAKENSRVEESEIKDKQEAAISVCFLFLCDKRL